MTEARTIIERKILGKTARQGALDAAKALADAGLLTPDLPEPGEKFTTGDASWTLTGKAVVDSWHDDGGPVVVLSAGRGRYLIPAEARQLAFILLAAANHAEEEE